jgi:hypothetical protein
MTLRIVKMHHTLHIWEASSEMVNPRCISVDTHGFGIALCIFIDTGLPASIDGSVRYVGLSRCNSWLL